MIKCSIRTVIQEGLCTGCGTCIPICPRGAIRLEMNQLKTLCIPSIEETLCTDCGLCYSICPGYSFDFNKFNMAIFGKQPKNILLGNYLNCYYGHSTDNQIRFNSASGGIITQILIYVLEEGIVDGALVTRMSRSNPLIPEPFIATTRDEIIEASKSKYCPVPANIALKEVIKADDKKRFAVVGLPCHIQGIRKVEAQNKKIKEKINLHIGIWCSTTCNFKGTEFIFQKYDININEIRKIDYRGEGWPGGLTIIFKNGQKKYIKIEEYWDSNFSAFAPKRCNYCIDCNAEFSDISCGDFRGRNAYLDEKIGNSAIITRTDQANTLLNKMFARKKIIISEITHQELSEHQYYFNVKKARVAIKLAKFFGKKTPEYNSVQLNPKTLDYFHEIFIITQRLLASKKQLWRLLSIFTELYLFTVQSGSVIQSKLRR